MNPRRIMIVDDMETMREMMLEAFQKRLPDVEYHTFENGKEALDFYKSLDTDPELIVTDLQMPIMDGEVFASEIREAGFQGCLVLCSGAPWLLGNSDAFDRVLGKDRIFEFAAEYIEEL